MINAFLGLSVGRKAKIGVLRTHAFRNSNHEIIISHLRSCTTHDARSNRWCICNGGKLGFTQYNAYALIYAVASHEGLSLAHDRYDLYAFNCIYSHAEWAYMMAARLRQPGSGDSMGASFTIATPSLHKFVCGSGMRQITIICTRSPARAGVSSARAQIAIQLTSIGGPKFSLQSWWAGIWCYSGQRRSISFGAHHDDN